MTPLTLNAAYGAAQTILFSAYALSYFFDSAPALIQSRGLRAAGLACCVAGLLLGAQAFVALRAVIQIAPQPRQGGRLVRSGAYRYFRHPIYSGIVLIVVGLFLRRPTLLVGVLTVLVIVVLTLKSAYEERLLAERYPEYAEYKRSAVGVIPFLT